MKNIHLHYLNLRTLRVTSVARSVALFGISAVFSLLYAQSIEDYNNAPYTSTQYTPAPNTLTQDNQPNQDNPHILQNLDDLEELSSDKIDKTIDSKDKKRCKGKNINTGCYIGFDVGARTFTTLKEPYKDYVSIPAHLNAGYMWYFAPRNALRFNTYLGYSSYKINNNRNTTVEIKNFTSSGFSSPSPLDDPFYPLRNAIYTQVASDINAKNPANANEVLHAIEYGLDISYLFDLIYTQNHILGLNVGFGAEMSLYLPSRFKASNATIDNLSVTNANNGLITMEYSGSISNDIATNVDLQAKFAIVASVGLHYFYYTNHQFFLTYQFREYGNNTIYLKNNMQIAQPYGKTQSVVISYAYKF